MSKLLQTAPGNRPLRLSPTSDLHAARGVIARLARPLFARLGVVLGAASLSAAELEIRPAVELEATTESGRLYQLERSADMVNWAPWGDWRVGDGTPHTVTRTYGEAPAYFRASDRALADLSGPLETLRAQLGVPALAVAVLQDGTLTAIGAVGQRRFGVDAPVSLADKWHHGSLTKSMTATLAAVLVEDGLIEWSTTLADVFPDKVAGMAAGWSEVTLIQLLSNSSGAPGDLNPGGIWTALWDFGGMPADGRQLLLDLVTAQPLSFNPGQGYEYSNAGFALAGTMLETVSGQTWESLMRERLFRPLGMSSAGFGPPATPRHLDHPVGHSGTVSNPTIWDPGTSADNPPAIGPAATVHASIGDLARYAQLHLRGGRGEAVELLAPASFDVLHTRIGGGDYALGWNVFNRPWAGGDALHHTGSNTQWYSNIWIAPEVNWACVVSMNFGGTNSFELSDAVVGYLIENHGP